MRKFSKIFENRDDLLTNLGTSEDEIKDICSELIDEGYKITMSYEYIGVNGHIYHRPNQTKEYYPAIDIELKRDIRGKVTGYDEREILDEFKDVRNWNGGVFYEGNINILKSIYELCYRFESTFTSDKANVFFSVKSINEISIRITFGVEHSKAPLDFSAIKEYMLNGFINHIDDESYVVFNNFINGDDKNMSVTINNKRDSVPIKKIIDRVLKQIPVSGARGSEYNGGNDQDYLLEKIFKPCVRDVYNFCKKQNDKVLLRWNIDGEVAKISINDKTLIQLSASFEKRSQKEVVVAKGIFKDKKEIIAFYSMDIKVSLTADY